MGGIVLLFQTQCVYNEHPSWGWDGEDQVTEGQGKLSLGVFTIATGMKHEYSGTTLIRMSSDHWICPYYKSCLSLGIRSTLKGLDTGNE